MLDFEDSRACFRVVFPRVTYTGSQVKKGKSHISFICKFSELWMILENAVFCVWSIQQVSYDV